MKPRPPNPRLYGQSLNESERRVVALLAVGLNVVEVRTAMQYGHTTIAKKLHRIQDKLGARSIAQAMYLWGRLKPRIEGVDMDRRLRDRADGITENCE